MRRECREHFPRTDFKRKPLVSDPGMRHVMHVGIANPRWRGNIPGIPGAWMSRPPKSDTTLLNASEMQCVSHGHFLVLSDLSSEDWLTVFITVTSKWARWRLRSPASRQLTQPLNTGAYERKHQSSLSLGFVREIFQWPANSPHKGPVTRKMFPFDDVIVLFCILPLPCFYQEP